ncbi:29662_t:CDS:2, partial [Racocetra persica]
MSKSEERLDEDNMKLIYNANKGYVELIDDIINNLHINIHKDYVELINDVSDKEANEVYAELIDDEDTPLIMLISEKKSDEDMQTSIPELFERMSILEDQSSQLTED